MMRPQWRSVLVLAIVLHAGGRTSGQAPQDQHDMHRLHGDPAAYMAALEDPKRDAYQKPHEVIEALRLRSGEVVADIGAGTGYFSLRLAHHVGPTGHVYAVDISADMIRRMNERIHEAGLVNISTILASSAKTDRDD